MPSVFLVMATAILTKPPIPLRVFKDRAQAEKWQADLIAYHISPPDMPVGDDAGSWKDYDARSVRSPRRNLRSDGSDHLPWTARRCRARIHPAHWIAQEPTS